MKLILNMSPIYYIFNINNMYLIRNDLKIIRGNFNFEKYKFFRSL